RDIQHTGFIVSNAAFGLGGEGNVAYGRGPDATIARIVQAILANVAIVSVDEYISVARSRATIHAQPVGVEEAGGLDAVGDIDQPTRSGIYAIDRDSIGRAIARGDERDVLSAETEVVAHINIVHASVRQELQYATLEIVYVEPRLLLCADNDAARRIVAI